MPAIMVYTEETYYYTEGIHVIAKEEYMRPDVTNLNFIKKMVSGLALRHLIPFTPCRESVR